MKTTIIVTSIAIIAILVGGFAGYAIARNQTANSNATWQPGVAVRGQGAYQNVSSVGARSQGINQEVTSDETWGGRGGSFVRGNRGWNMDQSNWQYMADAYADALGMTSAELQDELNSGKSLWDLASAQGITSEDFEQFTTDTCTQALNKMVADGILTQSQADAMLEQMHANWQTMNPESFTYMDGFGGGRSRAWRWSTP